jgi:hypothetical protein
MKFAVSDLKAVGASFSQLIASTMISRLVLNLRSMSDPPLDGPTVTMSMKFVTRTVGNLGGELESILEDASGHVARNANIDAEEIRLEDYPKRKNNGHIDRSTLI